MHVFMHGLMCTGACVCAGRYVHVCVCVFMGVPLLVLPHRY